jgi:antitoxin component of RelBE/YafQ-DinJ toxin-antitoxin module
MSQFDDFETRVSTHISLEKWCHGEFRKILIDYNLSMQEVFREFVSQIVAKEQYPISMLEKLEYEKRNKIVKKRVAKADAESIFKQIEGSTPFGRD